jgi:uncharacterized protein (DUF1697 family)
MAQFVAFLRAVNVGGHNKVKKETLRNAFISMGFSGVSVYKQSGNVIFEAAVPMEAIENKIYDELGKLLGINVTAFVRTMSQLNCIVESSPFKNVSNDGASFMVTFISIKAPSDMVLPSKIPNSTAEVLLIRNNEVYSITRGHGDGGKPNPFIESKFKTRATTRNLDIIKEIINKYSTTKK